MRAVVGRAAVAVLAVLLTVGCSDSGADSATSSGGDQAVSDSAADAGTGGGSGVTTDGTPAQVSPVDVAQTDRLVVATGRLGVAVEDVDARAADVVTITEAADGIVSGSTAGDGTATLTLRVPGAAFEQVLDDVAALGTQTDRSTSATDVTAEVADVDSRVASAQAVLTTFRDRLPQATTIPDILALEGEIATRQADLEALQARQRVLADQVALSSVEVSLSQQDPTTVAAASTGGFLGGLTTGWHALGTFLGAVLVVLGVVLPFAVPAAVVAGAVLLVRRRRPSGQAPS